MRDSLKYPAEETPFWMESGIKEMRINTVTNGTVSTWNQQQTHNHYQRS